jgi:hypothetical protein
LEEGKNGSKDECHLLFRSKIRRERKRKGKRKKAVFLFYFFNFSVGGVSSLDAQFTSFLNSPMQPKRNLALVVAV